MVIKRPLAFLMSFFLPLGKRCYC